LVFSVVQAATTGSTIRIHVSYKDNGLKIAISTSHPWLGEGLTQVDPYFRNPLSVPLTNTQESLQPDLDFTQLDNFHRQESLRLLLSCHLAQLQGGQISIEGTGESGYRYIVNLPQLVAVQESV
jgi:hypothetical protein